ncbi:MAG: hypothetical protein QG661_795 [Actinomycetota bacterium]|nr:hypothetical protein [Actinomycetota bacterium]
MQVTFSPSNVWRIGLVLLGVIALGLVLKFIIDDGGSVIFTVLMSWFAAIAMAPVVDRMARRMPRGVATLIVMLTFVVIVVVFVVAFGSLLIDQLTQLIVRIPELVDSALTWINQRFGTDLDQKQVLASFGGGDTDFGSLATAVGSNLIGIVSTVFGTFFGLFTFGLFTFYFSASMPRLQEWVARLFPTRVQGVVGNVWRLTAQKTGSYVGARVVLAGLSSFCTAIVFEVIGMPYWLPLALWTGVVAQFVPTIGTYIAIVLPVLVGLLSPNPWLGVIALAWGLLYQQVENLTIEPKISAKAVDINPAVAFGSVLLGAALFGIAGAFLAVPVTAMLLSLLDIYGRRYDLASELEPPTAAAVGAPPEPQEGSS